MHKLQERNIGCAVNYRAVHTLTYFKEQHGYRPEDFPVAHEIGKRTISFPLYPKLGTNDVERICGTVKTIMAGMRG